MTTIRNFFSPTKTSLVMTPSPVKTERKPIPIRPDNKLIVSNMKSVINSVKLHKKHKKRKRNLDEAPEIHDISNILQSNLSFISPNRTESQQNNVEITKDSSVTSIPAIDSPTVVSEDSLKENNSTNENLTPTPSQSLETKSQSASNAFEFMMTARYKSIGTNSPGKELANKEIKTPHADRDVSVKRKLMLEEWADRKGRAKKRVNEAAEDEYIGVVMAKRAKRLRTLLKNGKKQKDSETPDEVLAPTKPSNGLKLKISRGINRIEDSEDEETENRKTSTKQSKRLNGKRNGSVVDETFVEHLSSPLKKRDSLLGYFSKLTKTPSVDGSPNVTPSDNTSMNASDSAVKQNRIKKRGRPRKTLPVDVALDTQSTNDENSRQEKSSRHKVEEKVLLIDDRADTPTMSSPTKSDSLKTSLSEGRPKRLCRDKKISYLIEEDFITPYRSREKKVVDNVTPKTTKPSKLAPIFAKATPKPLIDPTVLRARHEFLMSGIPDKMKLEIEKQRQFEEYYEIEFEVFPKISHVGHHTDPNGIDIDLSKTNIRFKSTHQEEDETATHSFHGNNLLKVQPSQCDNREQIALNSSHTTINEKQLMRQLKQNDASEFPYYRCFKQLKNKNTTDPPSDDDADCDNSVELIVEKVEAHNGNELFTEKYRAMTSSEVVLNTKPLLELQKYLASWKENMDGRECANSSDEFESNSNSGMSSMNKAIVLTGPPGSGKTMFVYALANEMNFKVLEINAGARRNGKKVLKKLQEATQSHHVNNNQCSQGDRSKSSKSKYNQSEDSEDSVAITQKLSLILIEDAEVVFDDDFGFIESINQLVTTTKRPVILITNQVNCPHLSRFINRNMILFRVPKSTTASKWLSTLSVAEQCYVTEDMCRTLYQQNNCDFRKTLLELQFFIQSTNRSQRADDKSVLCTNTGLRDLFFKNQNQCDRIVPFPVDFTNLVGNNINQRSSDCDSTKAKSNTLNETIDFLNNISTAQWFDRKTDSSDRVVNHLNDEISHFMVEQSFKINSRILSSNVAVTIGSNSITRPQQLAPSISNRNHHSTRGIQLDVEPVLRSICRSELLRSHKERRSSRFYHYLRCANTDSFGTKSFDDHCLIFSNE